MIQPLVRTRIMSRPLRVRVHQSRGQTGPDRGHDPVKESHHRPPQVGQGHRMYPHIKQESHISISLSFQSERSYQHHVSENALSS